MKGVRGFVACVLLAGCAPDKAPLPGPAAFGLTEAPTEHVAVGAALARAGTILGPHPRATLVAGWKDPNSGVPVYTLTADSLASSEVIGTYDDCGCVLLSVARLDAWLTSQMGTGIGRLDIDRTALLTYMLLHELGHVAQGKTPCGMVFDAKAVGDARLNLTDTAQKACERSADTFASQAIREAMASKGMRGIAGSEVAIALSQLAFNLQAHRMLDQFGANAVRDPALFRDRGLSHPNLEWRILSANAMIARTSTAQELLDAFEQARTNGPVLFHLGG